MNGANDQVIKVAVLNTRQEAFDYLMPKSSKPLLGKRVLVPFRHSTRIGVIVSQGAPSTAIEKIKPIKALIDDDAIIDEAHFQLLRWVSRYYQAPLSDALTTALPKKLKLGKSTALPQVECYQLNLPLEEARALLPKQATRLPAILDHLNHGPMNRGQLSALGFNTTQLNNLVERRLITKNHGSISLKSDTSNKQTPLNLNEEQATAVESIKEQLDAFNTFLLYGVTGSGKTEVYLQVISRVLEKGLQVLVLVPEIGLTPQLVARFEARFHQSLCVLHSNLNDSERLHGWLYASQNKAQIIIGTRSCVLTPMPKLGLIVIDEEHDSSFKQMKGLRYSARETAIMRASFSNIPIILGSATPSLETLFNCQQGKYQCLRLTHQAISHTKPHYRLIDCRNQTMPQGLTHPAITAMDKHLSAGKQVLVFINRRGYAPVLYCHQCAWMADCNHCDSHMTVHYQKRLLQCHHCGRACRIPTHCPTCKGGELLPIGHGTQRITEYLSTRFPDHALIRVDRDSTSKKSALSDKLQQINSGQAQILVGTQMLAKGHHFPNLTLVIIVDADAGFFNQDFKAAERIGQLILQVAGRAGREHTPGEVLIQTHAPDNPLLLSLIHKGFDEFSHVLLKQRQQAILPPFSHLALIRAKAKNYNLVLNFLEQTKALLTRSNLNLLGPAPAPLEKKASLYRLQLLIKAQSRKQLGEALYQLRQHLSRNKLSRGIQWSIDVDPQDLS